MPELTPSEQAAYYSATGNIYRSRDPWGAWLCIIVTALLWTGAICLTAYTFYEDGRQDAERQCERVYP